MKTSLFILWFLATASDAIGGLLAAGLLYRMRDRYSFYMTIFFLAVVFESAVAALSLLLFWPDEPTAAPAFAFSRVVGRSVKMLGVWAYVLYLLGFINGVHKTHTPEGAP